MVFRIFVYFCVAICIIYYNSRYRYERYIKTTAADMAAVAPSGTADAAHAVGRKYVPRVYVPVAQALRKAFVQVSGGETPCHVGRNAKREWECASIPGFAGRTGACAAANRYVQGLAACTRGVGQVEC